MHLREISPLEVCFVQINGFILSIFKVMEASPEQGQNGCNIWLQTWELRFEGSWLARRLLLIRGD